MESNRISHYELVRRIGRGGMGEVWEGTDLKLRRPVALKFLSSELTAEPNALARFEREARAAAELSHPHIATVYAFEPDGERPFIAMELLSGPSLRERLEAGPLPIAEALGIARDVAAALAYAHRRGTSHRDIKPENLMFDEHGAIQVMDFGLARATMASRLTATGMHLGTPAYMAPETTRGESGPAADVFALGLVLWEMLAGRRLYPSDNAMAIMFQIANEPTPSVLEHRRDVPDGVVALLDRMLDKDPATRIEAGALARELAVLTGVSASIVSESIERRSRPGVRIVLIGLAIAALAAVAGLAFIQSRSAQREAEATRLHELALEASAMGRREEARELLHLALAKDPANSNVLSALGLVEVQEGRYARAESLFSAMVRHHPRDPAVLVGAYYNIGDIYSRRGMYGDAVTYQRRAFEADSATAETYNNLGWALIQNRQGSDALRVLERGIARFPGEASLYKNAGQALLQLGDPRRALARLERAVALDSTMTEALELRDRAQREAAGLR